MRINVKRIVFIYCIILSIVAFASLKIFFFGYQGGSVDIMTVQGMLLIFPVIILSLIIIIFGLSYFLSGVAKDADKNRLDGLMEFTDGFQLASKLYCMAIINTGGKVQLEEVISEINREQGEEIMTIKKIKQDEQSEQEEE